jgi:hypothetical protein
MECLGHERSLVLTALRVPSHPVLDLLLPCANMLSDPGRPATQPVGPSHCPTDQCQPGPQHQNLLCLNSNCNARFTAEHIPHHKTIPYQPPALPSMLKSPSSKTEGDSNPPYITPPPLVSRLQVSVGVEDLAWPHTYSPTMTDSPRSIPSHRRKRPAGICNERMLTGHTAMCSIENTTSQTTCHQHSTCIKHPARCSTHCGCSMLSPMTCTAMSLEWEDRYAGAPDIPKCRPHVSTALQSKPPLPEARTTVSLSTQWRN